MPPGPQVEAALQPFRTASVADTWTEPTSTFAVATSVLAVAAVALGLIGELGSGVQSPLPR
eukprot:CAMPEP_0172673680 /NCGR_PEP_ID=MMETSP1074-20121228/12291_1 /TAXON_ID=2916 /ORGANISM="Ceratium fusus, Strain PA161109" /LENGTH=60 /DNA_ID=CAMNT_0013491013 /DNA_START=580 /DNA_END=762 /DNA_ORIENTATION=+